MMAGVATSAVHCIKHFHKFNSQQHRRWLSFAKHSLFPSCYTSSALKADRQCPKRYYCTGEQLNMENSKGSDDDKKMKIGLVQMNSTSDKEANFLQARNLIQRAKIQGAQMVFLPECFDYVAETPRQAGERAETTDGLLIQRYRNLAREQDLWLSLGGFHNKPEDTDSKEGIERVRNTHLVIGSDGEIHGQYSKVHLFDVDIEGAVRLKETDFTIPGTTLGPPVSTPVGRVGMGICYDLRFPEFSTVLTQQGAEILTYPSAFTVPTGKAHWEILLRCRAIENQSYVVAAAQVGQHNPKRASYGHAMVVDPWGTILAECPDKPDVKVVDIDLNRMNKTRKEMPVWNHRRPDVYGNLQITTNAEIDTEPHYRFGQVQVLSRQVFHKTALSFAFVNKKPVLPGHVLISPIRVVPRLSDLTPAEVADLFQTAQKVQVVIEKFCEASSSTVAVQDGPDAGQSIEHVHVHVLPRKPGDFKQNDDIYAKLEKHDKNVRPSQWRTDEEMSAEAATLRPFFV